MEDGCLVEVATVGREGLVGIGAVLGNSISSGDAFVGIAGEPAAVMTQRLPAQTERVGRSATLTRIDRRSWRCRTQSVACNGLHSAEQRCCRWLLMTTIASPRTNSL